MPAGTITLTNNSAVVKGAGTAFTTELRPGDFIVAVVGGVTYTLPVKTIDNATQVTLTRVYDGPTQAGAAWSAVPRETLNAITAQLAAESSRALRGLNYDKDNWQQLFSGTGNITVKLPDGSTFTGPAWGSYAAQLSSLRTDVNAVAETAAGKLAKDKNLSDLSDKAAARKNLQLGTDNVPWFGGLELSAATPFIDFHYASSTSDFSSRLICDAADKLTCTSLFRAKSLGCKPGVNGSHTGYQFNFNWTSGGLEAWVDYTMVGLVSLNTSDKRIKKDINEADGNLEKLMKLRPVTFRFKNVGVWSDKILQRGFIAQEVAKAIPEAVYGEVLLGEETSETPSSQMGLNILPLISVLTGAIQEQQQQITELKNRLNNLEIK
ncbi:MULTISPECIES: tail fiber domain-containing protein [unclassified Serratia (in: enterobacteria)]|uniref:tail fiber domain-containing protein n=1 Tax=unclassified Serratia (in: enterobacteria) TaxID=2647522 RepID=UPI00046A23A1|nr:MULTISPECIES: tail fiber domain-containing protein [unclassified Serratia (in: enterobacteria)]